MSAVLPISADSALSRILPLAAGLAVCRAVGDFGVEGVRMRWPNDVLVQDAKLAGILLDQFVAGRCVIGIGLNVSNRPEQCDRSLSGRVARLADLVHPVPSLNALLQHLLEHLEIVCHQSEAIGVQALLPAINSLWPERRNVELQLDGQVISGAFEGVDAAGRLQLRTRGDECRYYEPHQVQLLREKIYT
jgi:BirA family biotin operon repressor/biotin-[acetyl-CoA-carboxylase] ligase